MKTRLNIKICFILFFSESSTTKPLEESNATLVVVLCILVPITIICVVLIFLYAQRRTRKRKADFKNIEIDSVVSNLFCDLHIC